MSKEPSKRKRQVPTTGLHAWLALGLVVYVWFSTLPEPHVDMGARNPSKRKHDKKKKKEMHAPFELDDSNKRLK